MGRFNTEKVILLDAHGRIVWPESDQGRFIETVASDYRANVAELLCGVILEEKTAEINFLETSSGWCCARLQPTDLLGVSVCLIVADLPTNFLEFGDQDLQLLRLLAEDHSIKEIAELMQRSQSAIDARIKSLKEKLGRETLHGLVAAAIKSRLV